MGSLPVTFLDLLGCCLLLTQTPTHPPGLTQPWPATQWKEGIQALVSMEPAFPTKAQPAPCAAGQQSVQENLLGVAFRPL